MSIYSYRVPRLGLQKECRMAKEHVLKLLDPNSESSTMGQQPSLLPNGFSSIGILMLGLDAAGTSGNSVLEPNR